MSSVQHVSSMQQVQISNSFRFNPKLKNAILLIAFFGAISLFLTGLVYQVLNTGDMSAGIKASSEVRELSSPGY